MVQFRLDGRVTDTQSWGFSVSGTRVAVSVSERVNSISAERG